MTPAIEPPPEPEPAIAMFNICDPRSVSSGKSISVIPKPAKSISSPVGLNPAKTSTLPSLEVTVAPSMVDVMVFETTVLLTAPLPETPPDPDPTAEMTTIEVVSSALTTILFFA